MRRCSPIGRLASRARTPGRRSRGGPPRPRPRHPRCHALQPGLLLRLRPQRLRGGQHRLEDHRSPRKRRRRARSRAHRRVALRSHRPPRHRPPRHRPLGRQPRHRPADRPWALLLRRPNRRGVSRTSSRLRPRRGPQRKRRRPGRPAPRPPRPRRSARLRGRGRAVASFHTRVHQPSARRQRSSAHESLAPVGRASSKPRARHPRPSGSPGNSRAVPRLRRL